MKKLTLGTSAAISALVLAAGVAIAADAPRAMNHGRMAETTTRAEAQTRAGEMFDRFDVNKDGKIDEADRAAHRAQMFDKVDANYDGNISRDEFASSGDRGRRDAPSKAITNAELTAAALKHFDAADANKDGKLTPDERRTAMRSHMQEMRGHMGGHDMGGMGDAPKPQ